MARAPEVVAEMQARARLCMDAVAQAMAHQDYILGADFSGADIMLGYTLMISERLLEEDISQSLQPYWQRLSTRPGFKVAKQA